MKRPDIIWLAWASWIYMITLSAVNPVTAALFTPLRRRIQKDIDRRFFRRNYVAQRTLEAFSASPRGELDLEELSDRPLAVVEDAREPAHASVWLRERKV